MSRISVFILLAITFGLNLPGQTSPNVSDDWRALRQEGARQFDANNLAQADALFTRALEMARATSDPRAIVRTIEELGIIYYRSNRYDEAKRCFTEVMEIAKQVKDLDASAVVLAYNYFGLTERDLYHYAASVAWHRRALDFLLNDAFPRGELSSEERATRSKLRAETEFALGVALHVYGLHKEAEEHYRNALETSKDHKGLDNLDTVRALTGLARLALEQSNPGATRQYVRRAEKILQAVAPPDSPEWLDFQDVTASMLFCEGKYTEAERRWHEALELGEKNFGPLHPNVLVTLARLGEFHLMIGENDKAIEYLSKSVTDREKVYGKNNPELAIVASELALAYTRKHEYVKATVNYDRALQLLEQNPGGNQLALAFTLQQKGDFHLAQSAWTEAVQCYEKSARLLEAGLGDDHPALASVLMSCAKALRKNNRKKDAKAYEERARAIQDEPRDTQTMARHTVDVRTLRAANR